MSDYISGGISFAGLGNGTDFQALIEELKSIESIPRDRYIAWREDWQERYDALDELVTACTDAMNALEDINTMNEMLTKTATSSNSTVATADVDSDVAEGTYEVDVQKLATNSVHTLTATTFESKETVVAPLDGADMTTFAYNYNGEDIEVLVPKGMTLEGMVNQINKDPNNPGVQATLIHSGGGYIFQLQGKDTGADYNITINPETTVPGFDPTSGWNSRAAQDAEFSINGLTDVTFTSSSNELTEVFEGMTINLTSVGSATLTVTTDTSKVRENVEHFVETINTLLVSFQNLTKVEESTDEEESDTLYATQYTSSGSVLTGNYGVQLLNSELKTIATGLGVGFVRQDEDGNGDMFAALSSIGIQIDADDSSPTFGQLIILEEDTLDPDSPYISLDEALEKDAYAVAELIAGKSGQSDSTKFIYNNALEGTTESGIYDVDYSVAGGVIGDVYIGNVKAEHTGGNQYTLSEGPGKGLSITILDTSDGDHEGTVRIKQGKAIELIDTLSYQLKNDSMDSIKNDPGSVAPERGPLQVIMDNYADIMESIDLKIEQEEDRLARWEATQRDLFARLDVVLGQYDMQMQANASSLSQLQPISG